MPTDEIALTRNLPVLPLRLAAEPYAKRSISTSCVALGVHTSTDINLEVAVLVDDHGVRAFSISKNVSRRILLNSIGLDASTHESSSMVDITSPSLTLTQWENGPLLCLVRSSPSSNDMQWCIYLNGENHPVEASTEEIVTHSSDAFHDDFIAKLLTESIRMYYAQQILEPSVRGFLAVLEKQFARSDLYLFELLQNAVDDGATIVRVSCHAIGNQKGLRVIHNGRNFTPLDVLGLSSVGLSTKSREGKRTIGFMGVGFKAVYKRYDRVVIDDGTYAFAYEKPTDADATGYGWVMQPLWIDKHDLKNSSSKSDTKGWCHFQLERPVGGMAAVVRDLSVLPLTAPPLLGRAALSKRTTTTAAATTTTTTTSEEPSDDSWNLDWNGKLHSIRRINLTGHSTSNASFRHSSDRSEIVTVNITDRSSGHDVTTRWLFVSHKYVPSRKAAESYRKHTKRSHYGEEEVCGFVRLGGKDGCIPLCRGISGSLVKGIVHSVLPTKLRIPIPMNVQGAWLLSVDRQEIQDLGDNHWNRELVQRLPILIVNMFRWAARERLSDAAHYGAICNLLPTIVSSSPSSSSLSTSMVTEFLGQSISLEEIEKAFFLSPILPVAVSSNKDAEDSVMDTNTSYYEGKHSIWVPPCWFKFLSPDFLRGWLGKRPLRSDFLDRAAFHPLFSSDRVINQLSPLPNRTVQLSREIGLASDNVHSSSIEKILHLMAAIGAAYDEHPNNTIPEGKANGSFKKVPAPAESVDAKSFPSPSLPSSTKMWPVFLAECGKLLTSDQVIVPAADFAIVPADLRLLLRPFFVSSPTQTPSQREPQNTHQKKRGRNNIKGGTHRKGANMRPSPGLSPKKMLHPMLETAIYDIDLGKCAISKGSQDTESLVSSTASFLSRVRVDSPSNVVCVDTAVNNLFVSYSKKKAIHGEDQISTILRITQFALSTNNPALIRYVLVDVADKLSPSKTLLQLVPAKEAYIGKLLDQSESGADLRNFSAGLLQFIASRYNDITESDIAKRNLLRLFDLAGVQSGLSAVISAVVDIEKGDRRIYLKEVLPKLADNKLPKTRKTATKNPIFLPYDLGVPMDRHAYSLIDAQLPTEWERVVKTMSSNAAVAFISLLLAMPVDDALNITGKTTPAAAKCLTGQAEEVTPTEKISLNATSSDCQSTVRISSDTAVPLRKRMYYLPPGQPGAVATDISESGIVKQLSSWKWLPCIIESQSSDGTNIGTITLFRPKEAILLPDIARPEMPVVQLPPALLKRLVSSPFAKAVAWGEISPPAPVFRLAELVQEANELILPCGLGGELDVHRISSLASELVTTWISIARVYLRDGLNISDQKTLRTICESGDLSHCVPVTQMIDARNGRGLWILPIFRCVRISQTNQDAPSEDRNHLKNMTVVSLVESNFMCDFNRVSGNPFSVHPDVSAAIIQLAKIPTLGTISTRTVIKACGAFVRFCCASEPTIASRSSPLRSSFSFAMRWCMEEPNEFPKDDTGGIKLWVRRGPGFGTKALPARWVPLKNRPMRLVLDDDKTKARSSLLTPELGFQTLGILDHFTNERDCSNVAALAAIDHEVVSFLGVSRLSDKGFSVRTKARGQPKLLNGASLKLQLVCTLLKSIESERNCNIKDIFLNSAHTTPQCIRYELLTREFQVPGMSTALSTPVYSVWGRAPKHLASERCILLCGDPDDYSIELEQLILNHASIDQPSISNMKPYRAALRLLSHLENETSFEKFLDRDFSDSEGAVHWRRLIARDIILGKLKTAEGARDANALRDILIQAEEICEDDVDEGDSILNNARELLPKLEEEVKNRREAEEKKKLEETKKEETIQKHLREDKEAFEQWKEEEKLKAISKLNIAIPSETADVCILPRGRGRGLTLPSWVTSGVGAYTSKVMISDDTLKAGCLEKAKSIVSSILHEVVAIPPETNVLECSQTANSDNEVNNLASKPTIPVGKGRGISNAPAWMTSSEPREGVEVPAALTSLPTLGRGRGVSKNLPAWMMPGSSQSLLPTTDDNNFADAEELDPKRYRMEELPAGTQQGDRPTKKARTHEAIPFEFAIKGSMEAARLPLFLSLLRSKVEEEAKRCNGSATLERSGTDS